MTTTSTKEPVAPLKRHRALAPFSRDHHLVLQLARGLQRGVSARLEAELPRDREQRRLHVLDVFAKEIAPHFDEEEALLFPAVDGRDASLDAVIAEIAAEHALIRSLFGALGRERMAAQTIDAILDRLGRELEAHVRREERSFYARLQRVLAPSELDALADRATRHLDVQTTFS